MLRLLPRVSSLMISNLPVDSPAFLKNLSRVFPVLVVANTGSCVRPQSKIGHPACRYRQLIQFSVLGFRGICHHHYHLSLNREGRWGTTDDFKTSFLHFDCSPLPSGTCRTPGLSIPRCCLPTSPLPLSALSSSPFHCALQDGFGQT